MLPRNACKVIITSFCFQLQQKLSVARGKQKIAEGILW